MKGPSLLGRALLALGLMVGFYAVALGIAGGLVFFVFAQVVYLHFISLKLSLACLLGAGVIVWSILPRFDRFEAPGPRILPEDHPKLFDAIRDVARRTGQAAPAEVYLVSDINAFVSQRCGIMGFFSKRVMGLGLPLCQVLTVSQLRAVLAHEFGHFHGGDTRVGAFIYKTRSAIIRTVVSLAKGGGFLHLPFVWYAELFLKITHSLSRRQEYAADELAARVVGANHLVEGLKVTHGGAIAYQAFWNGEYMPAIASGFKPPLASGFASFLKHEKLASAVDKAVNKELTSAEEDPFDTHPPLAKRIEALNELTDSVAENDDRPAIELLNGADKLEKSVLEAVIVNEHFRTLKDIQWDQANELVHIPGWEKAAKNFARHFEKLSPRTLPLGTKAMSVFAFQLADDIPENTDEADAAHFAANCIGAVMANALVLRGWSVTASLGDPFVFAKEDASIELFTDLHALASGEMKPEQWLEKVESLGVHRMRLIPKEENTDESTT